jgi:hypothetical protein
MAWEPNGACVQACESWRQAAVTSSACTRSTGRAACRTHLWRKLERAKRKVTNHVGVADDDVVLMHLSINPIGRVGRGDQGEIDGRERAL